MPNKEEHHGAIADLMINEQLVAGSDGGDDQNGHIVCSIILASEDLLDYHISSHEVFGEPKDSGRAEMMGVMAIVVYLCHIIKWYELPEDTSVTLYSDSAETVKFVNRLWIGATPKWADERNIEMKRTIKRLMQTIGKGIRLEHTHGHQDKQEEFENLPLPAKLNVMCDRECKQKLKTV